MVPTNSLTADGIQSTLVVLRAGLDDECAGRVEIDRVAGRAADRVATVHEHRNRARR